MKIQVIGDTIDLKKTVSQDIDGEPNDKIWVQIYEIQTPAEAETMIELGVDRIGSVVSSMENWKNPDIKETIRLKEGTPVKSSLIPLTKRWLDRLYAVLSLRSWFRYPNQLLLSGRRQRAGLFLQRGDPWL